MIIAQIIPESKLVACNRQAQEVRKGAFFGQHQTAPRVAHLGRVAQPCTVLIEQIVSISHKLLLCGKPSFLERKGVAIHRHAGCPSS